MADAHITAPTRTCTRCGIEKPAALEHFPPHRMGKYGLHPRCRPCKKLADAEQRDRPGQRARQKTWRDANKDRVRAYNDSYRAAGYSSTEHVSRWRALNIEHAREKERAKQRKYRKRPEYRLKARLSSRLSMLVNKAGRRTDDILGFSGAELCRHLERQFLPGMTWDNVSEWEIDHIIPVSAFNVKEVGDADFRACWALTNLRPLWRSANRSKGNKVLTLL